MTEPAVLYELRDNGVAVLTLNRPDRLNAWGMDIAVPFYELIDRADADEAVRVIVVTGAGRGFCAGADLSGGGATSTESLGDDLGNTDENALSAILGDRQPYTLTAVRKPVIAAVNGPCIGFGFTLALMCDVRFVAAGAKFGATFVRLGLVAEQGISWILPRVVGAAPAADLLLSGRKFDAAEALRLGLVKEVVADGDLLTRAIEYADELATRCSPWALAQIKGQLYDESDRAAVAATTARSVELMNLSIKQPDVIEGITSFFERRDPRFPPLASLPPQ